MERLVIKGFRDKESHEDEKKMTVYPRGSKFISTDEKRVKALEDKGHLKKVQKPNQDAPKRAAEVEKEADAAEQSNEPETNESELKHVGGGYYELPNGDKVQGKDKALEALAKAGE